jgi:hypothetical protein
MRLDRRWMAGLLLISGLLLSACASAEEEGEPVEHAAVVEPIEGTELALLTLTPEAVERLDIQTSTSRDVAGSGTEIPYAAVFYTATGDTWTYTNPEPLTFVRAPITIDHIDGGRAFLSDGPPAGTAVVTQGLAELYGTETGVEE